MKKFVGKQKCCNNAVIQMWSATLEATKQKSTFGYEKPTLTQISCTFSALETCFCPVTCFLNCIELSSQEVFEIYK